MSAMKTTTFEQLAGNLSGIRADVEALLKTFSALCDPR
jgi:hypothetical protein